MAVNIFLVSGKYLGVVNETEGVKNNREIETGQVKNNNPGGSNTNNL